MSGILKRTLRPVGLGALLLVTSLVQQAEAVDPNRSIHQYNSRTWRRDSGLPANSVNAMTVTSDGRLWLATSKGLVHFDGVEFHQIEASQEGTVGSRVMLVVSTREEGGVWFGMDSGGFDYYANGQVHSLELPAELRTGSIHNLFELPDGTLVCTTSINAYLIKDGNIEGLFPGRAIDVSAFHLDAQGREWYGTVGKGVYYRENGTLHTFPHPATEDLIVHDIKTDAEGNLWIASADRLLLFDQNFEEQHLPEGHGQPNTLLIDSHGVLWVGTYGRGLARLVDGQYQIFNRSHGLANDQVISLEETPDGSLWIGTADGLTQLSDLKFPILSRTEGLVSEGSLTVAPSRDGGIWVGTPDGASKYKDGEFTSYGQGGRDGFGSRWIKRVFDSIDGNVYFVGARKNLDRFKDGKVIQTWYCDDWITDVTEDSRSLIISIGGSVHRLENDELKPFLLADGTQLNTEWILDLEVTNDGSLWIAEEDSLLQVKDGVLHNMSQKSGFGPSRFFFLSEDAEGQIWAATTSGIVRCKDEKLSLITRQHGLHEDYVYAIVPDLNGNFWIDSNRGIFRVSQDEMNAVADGRAISVSCTVYEGSDSVKTTDKIAQEYVGARSADGRIWFPSSKGVIMIDPTKVPRNRRAPQVSIVRARVNGVQYDLNNPPEIEPGPDNLEFEYAAIEYLAPQKVRYRYRLNGFESEWVEANSRRAAFYTNLPPGKYEFEVQACNADGVWNTTGARLDLELPQRFHETTAFRASLIIALAGFSAYLAWVWGLHRRQVQLRHAHTQMEAEVRARTAELASMNDTLRTEVEVRKHAQAETERLHDELRASALAAEQAAAVKGQFLANMSHEIRTPISGVLGMSNLLLDTELDPQQREFAETTRNSAEALLTILNDILDFSKMEAGKLALESVEFDIRSVVDEALDLLAMRAASRKVELASLISYELPPMWKGDPSRLRQVLLNLIGNAVKFTEDGEVVVAVSRESHATAESDADFLRFEIRDTGIGISRAIQERLFQPFMQADSSTTRRYGGTGLGLAISRQIVELMGGTIGVESEPNEGSVFWFSVPIVCASKPEMRNPRNNVPALKGVRVLAVDAGPTYQQVILHHANAWGMQVSLVENAQEAEAIVQAGPPDEKLFDIIIAGIQVTTDDISQLSKLLKAPGAGLGIIRLTSVQKWIGTRDKGERTSRTIALKKPIREEALLQACLQALGIQAENEEEPIREEEAAIEKAGKKAKQFPPMRVLVAEDNLVNQRVVQLMLKKWGIVPDLAGNGVEALQAVEKAHYDIVLMDCQMPELDGYETTRKLRASGYDDIYIIAMTANTLEGDREKCLMAGMDDYLSKPTRDKDLHGALSRAVASGKFRYRSAITQVVA